MHLPLPGGIVFRPAPAPRYTVPHLTACEETVMNPQSYQSCIDACHACATACDNCAAACLAEQDVKAMAKCIALDLDCAQACRLAAALMGRGSRFAPDACRLCGDICQACAEECGTHEMDHCQACSDACRHCAQACLAMAA